MRVRIRKSILVVVITYMVVAGLWIMFSDELLARMFGVSAVPTKVSIYKGWFFVLVTGLMLYALVCRQVRRLENAIKERDVLLSELNHRVNNSLQLIANLINLQRRRIGDREPGELLDDLRDRIRSISLAHDKLYLEKGISNINLRAYTSDLAKAVYFSYGADKTGISLNLDITPDIRLDIGQAVAVGLIINEIVGNSLKYAFPNGKGEITVSMKPLGKERVELVVRDNGAGLPPGYDPRQAKTLGMQLIFGLVEKQLDGTIELDRKKGTAYRITFKRQNV